MDGSARLFPRAARVRGWRGSRARKMTVQNAGAVARRFVAMWWCGKAGHVPCVPSPLGYRVIEARTYGRTPAERREQTPAPPETGKLTRTAQGNTACPLACGRGREPVRPLPSLRYRRRDGPDTPQPPTAIMIPAAGLHRPRALLTMPSMSPCRCGSCAVSSPARAIRWPHGSGWRGSAGRVAGPAPYAARRPFARWPRHGCAAMR